jgi:hypothetical protein
MFVVKHGGSVFSRLNFFPTPMHPKSPRVSATDGAATLRYKIGKEDWLKRFLDVEGTHSFDLQMRQEPWQDREKDTTSRFVL